MMESVVIVGKAKYKFLRLAFLYFLALILTACGGGGGDDSEDDDDNNETPDTVAPSQITDLSVQTLSASSVQLSWSAPGDDGASGSADSYDIRYASAVITEQSWGTASTISNEPTPGTSGSAETATLFNLQENTEYFFAIRAYDEAQNSGSLSNIVSATTDQNSNPDTTAPAAVNDLSANALSSSSVSLDWTATGDDNNQGTASGYDIRYSTSAINDGNWSGATQVSNEPLPESASTLESFDVSGLSANTQYYFAMRVVDEAQNESDLSNLTNVTTEANQSGAATTPGAVSTPYPTVKHISVEWEIDGDNDEDGVVSVRYRPEGTSTWINGMDLFRVTAGSNVGFSWTNKHSGSLFDLQPDTNYEIELSLIDPDGGSDTRTTQARTRPIPVAPVSANIVNADPSSLVSLLSSANPGDMIVLANGTYSGFTVSRNGSDDLPIVIRGNDANNVIINGDVRADGQQNIFFERLTVNGQIKFNGAENIVVRESNINANVSGIVAQGAGVTNAYIVDNRVIGVTPWANSALGVNGANTGEGIQLTGPGNVIAYNFVKGFRDGISTMEQGEAINQLSIDIYNNDVEVGADDGIEADFAMGNVRVLNNRLTNNFIAISSQPGLGGPTYIIGNVMYNSILTNLKLYRGSVGDVILHNTSIKTGDGFTVTTDVNFSRAFIRNNIFIGGEGGGVYGGYHNGSGRVVNVPASASSNSLNYDGYGSIGTGSFEGRIGSTFVNSLAELRAQTSETDAQQVDMSIFADSVPFPSSGPFPERSVPNLLLQSNSAAIDTGVIIPGLNDDYNGNAPDLGAYEFGDQLPQYGPR